MGKLAFLLALSCSVTMAIAGDKAVVVKDTRQYLAYTQKMEKDGVCVVASDPDHPRDGDCKEARYKAAVGGEWIIRVGGLCHREIYGRPENDESLERRPVLSLSTKVDEFKCDERGNPI
ncbi:hypothetical protein QZM82_35350 [Burkholderia cepacia]|uniref:hypothetical protein n=1 Tax=Burkholderia cepacia TaxID=292 RepID=UPI00264AB108|nr:hypothetical protein [Burkholderia cepacia]MDN7901480.1 hypothetical protein [Burkholderia cepacia]